MPCEQDLCFCVMDVEVRHLRCLVAIAEEGTLTGAAARLRIGQPAVSRTLAQLEVLLGVRLVDRTTRRLELTPDGVAFHRASLRALAAVQDAVTAVTDAARPLRVGYCWAAAGPHTTPILRAWRQAHPQVPVELNRHDERTAGLASGQADLALVRVGLDRDRFARVELYREPRYVAMSDGDPLAGRGDVRLADLAGRGLAVVSAYGTTTLSLWPEGGRPTIAADLRNLDDWLAVIGSGQAIGVTAASTAHQYPRPGVRYSLLADAPPVLTWLAWDRRHVHPWQERFVALARGVVLDHAEVGGEVVADGVAGTVR